MGIGWALGDVEEGDGKTPAYLNGVIRVGIMTFFSKHFA